MWSTLYSFCRCFKGRRSHLQYIYLFYAFPCEVPIYTDSMLRMTSAPLVTYRAQSRMAENGGVMCVDSLLHPVFIESYEQRSIYRISLLSLMSFRTNSWAGIRNSKTSGFVLTIVFIFVHTLIYRNIFLSIYGAVCRQLTQFAYHDCENVYFILLSSSNRKYESLRVRSWNNGMRCMS